LTTPSFLRLFDEVDDLRFDQHPTLDRPTDTGALDLSGLEDHVAVGEDDRAPQPAAARQHLQRTRVKPLGERVVEEVRGHQ
jgi:hypothetical protein